MFGVDMSKPGAQDYYDSLGVLYLNPASNLLFSCKFARKSALAPEIYAAVDQISQS
jgi:hypothetical protein